MRPELVQKYHMFVAPLKIIFRDGEYADGIDLTAGDLYQRLPLEIPKTSLPSAETVLQILDQIRSEGYNKVLTITISSGLEAARNNMLKLLAANIKDLDMYVYDTKKYCHRQWFFCYSGSRVYRRRYGLADIKTGFRCTDRQIQGVLLLGYTGIFRKKADESVWLQLC